MFFVNLIEISIFYNSSLILILTIEGENFVSHVFSRLCNFLVFNFKVIIHLHRYDLIKAELLLHLGYRFILLNLDLAVAAIFLGHRYFRHLEHLFVKILNDKVLL